MIDHSLYSAELALFNCDIGLLKSLKLGFYPLDPFLKGCSESIYGTLDTILVLQTPKKGDFEIGSAKMVHRYPIWVRRYLCQQYVHYYLTIGGIVLKESDDPVILGGHLIPSIFALFQEQLLNGWVS